MAVFKQELNWSTYQDAQLDALKSIKGSLENSLRVSLGIAGSMDSVEKTMLSIAKATENSAKNIVSLTEKFTGNALKFSGSIEESDRSLKGLISSILRTNQGLSGLRSSADNAGSSVSLFSTIIGSVSGKLQDMAKVLDNYSTLSNNMIRLSGMSGQDVREFKSEIMGVVRDLNRDTGGLYNPQEAYKDVIAVSQGITSNLDAIEEMARPLLLTQETLDVGINTVADLFNRFYTRYTFSSEAMEKSLDEIRGNTAGNSANAEATLRNVATLENWIANYAAGDEELLAELMSRVSHYTSWLESMELDSEALTSYLEIAASGRWADNRELVNILSRSGISTTQATDMARSGQFEELTSAMMDGIYDIVSQFDTNNDKILGEGEAYAFGKALENYGISEDLALEVWNVRNSAGYQTLAEFIQENSGKDMEELAEDKYVSLADRANNWLERIYATLANIQERFGIGLSDVIIAYAASRNILGSYLGGGSSGTGESRNVGSLLMSGAHSVGNWSNTRGITTFGRGANWLSSHSMGGLANAAVGPTDALATAAGAGGGLGGAAMLAGGVTAGGLLAYDGIKDIFSEDSDQAEKVLSGVEAAGGLGGAAALIGLGVSNPVGWVALAIGGIAFLTKKVYDHATALSGNAQETQRAFKELEASLGDERTERISTLADLKTTFREAESLDEQRNLLESAGLATKEELATMEEEAMSDLIDAYLNGAKSINEITEDYLQSRSDEIASEQNTQQRDLMSALNKSHLSYDEYGNPTSRDTAQDRRLYTDAVSLLKEGVTDEDLLARITNYLKDGEITSREWMTLTKSSIFNNKNFVESAVDPVIMQRFIDAYGSDFGINMTISQFDQGFEEAAGALLGGFEDAWQTFRSSIGKDPTTQAAALSALNSYIDNMMSGDNRQYYDALNSQGAFDTFRPMMRGNGVLAQYDIHEFAVGTNYVPRDQLAVIHEGEAIVPKKYNPAANSEEFKLLARQLQHSQIEARQESQETLEYLSEFLEEIKDIGGFLRSWKSDNEKNERLYSAKSKHRAAMDAVNSYQPIMV